MIIMKKLFWYLCATFVLGVIISYPSTQASAKTYHAVDRNLKSVTLETKHTSKGYKFALKYPGKKKKVLTTSFRNEPPFRAQIMVARHSKQPTLIICSLENNGWPHFDRVYTIKSGKLTKVKVKGHIGSMSSSYKSDNMLYTTYYDRFIDTKYTYISKYYRASNILKTIKTKAKKNYSASIM